MRSAFHLGAAMAGLDMSDPRYAGPAERAAFANGQQAMQGEIDQLREALRTVHAMLNGPSRYKARNARLYLDRLKVLHDVTPSST
jgi:hypothetical protein